MCVCKTLLLTNINKHNTLTITTLLRTAAHILIHLHRLWQGPAVCGKYCEVWKFPFSVCVENAFN